MIKLCECGCGHLAPITKGNDKKRGWIKGQPKHFIQGHNSRGASHPSWKGGKTINSQGYIMIHRPNHPQAHNNYVREHILVAEKALVRFLPLKAIMHHINGDTFDNRNENLVICENRAYHLLLHQRQRAYEACGHANWRKCRFCKQYDDPGNMFISQIYTSAYHNKCANEDNMRRYYHKRNDSRT